MIERTLVLIKPDAVQRGLVGEILERFEKCGLKIIGMKMKYADRTLAGKHYADDDEWMTAMGEKTLKSYEKKGIKLDRTALEHGKWVRETLIDFISMSPIIAIALEGHNAVAHVRKLVGPTAPGDAPPGTIRGDYSFETYQMADDYGRPLQNLIHASGEVSEAEREIKVWFTKDELYAWKRVDEELIYRKG